MDELETLAELNLVQSEIVNATTMRNQFLLCGDDENGANNHGKRWSHRGLLGNALLDASCL